MITSVLQQGRLVLLGLMLSIKTHLIVRLVRRRPMTEKGPYTGYFVQDLFRCDGPVLQVHCFNPPVLVEVRRP